MLHAIASLVLSLVIVFALCIAAALSGVITWNTNTALGRFMAREFPPRPLPLSNDAAATLAYLDRARFTYVIGSVWEDWDGIVGEVKGVREEEGDVYVIRRMAHGKLEHSLARTMHKEIFTTKLNKSLDTGIAGL